ncbi:MAG: hypothetical protein ACLPKB_04175 [Xanthobacteraceae bacterium]
MRRLTIVAWAMTLICFVSMPKDAEAQIDRIEGLWNNHQSGWNMSVNRNDFGGWDAILYCCGAGRISTDTTQNGANIKVEGRNWICWFNANIIGDGSEMNWQYIHGNYDECHTITGHFNRMRRLNRVSGTTDPQAPPPSPAQDPLTGLWDGLFYCVGWSSNWGSGPFRITVRMQRVSGETVYTGGLTGHLGHFDWGLRGTFDVNSRTVTFEPNPGVDKPGFTATLNRYEVELGGRMDDRCHGEPIYLSKTR